MGSANIDFVCRMPRIPSDGETIISGDTYAFVPGGKGANTAVAASRLGGDVVFCAAAFVTVYILNNTYMEFFKPIIYLQ